MSDQSTHHHTLVNSLPQTPQQHHHQPSLTAPIHPENHSVDDVVSFPNVPKVPHTPDEYDPECQCSTCKLATKLLAECTCEQCKGTEQPDQSSENVPIANAVSPTNGQPSSSSIQNNDASTSELTNANDRDDDHSRSSTPDYLPRFFDDENGDSSSDDSEDDDDETDKELDKESESEENNDNSDPAYALSDSSSDDSKDDSGDDDVHDKDDSSGNMEVVIESESLNSIVHSQPSTSYQNVSVTNFDISNSSDNKLTNLVNEKTPRTPTKCPKCAKTFSEIRKLLRHYRGVHQEWKPYYCRWPKCKFASPLHDLVVHHANRTHFKSQNRHKAKKYVGKRDESPLKDPVLEKISEIKFRHEEKIICQQCGRNLPKEHIKKHIRTHASPGIRCTWPNCRFFYSQLPDARTHVCVDHLQVEQADSQQIIQHLVIVNPKTGETTKIKANKKQKRVNDNDDDHSRSSTPDYLPRFFDDESGDSSSDESSDPSDNESTNLNYTETGSNIGLIPVKCPKCEQTFTHRCRLLFHYGRVHQEWKPYYCRWPKCNFTSAIDHLVITHADSVHFKFQNRQKAKSFVGKRDEVPPKDPVFEQIVAIKFVRKNKNICLRCGRKLSSENLKRHILSHSNPGFRCVWPNCGFFYSNYEYAKKHLLKEHLKDKLVNATQLNEHLINVNPNSHNSNGSQNNDASTSERFNASDHNDDSERSSTQNYMPRKFDDDYKDNDYESESDSDDRRNGFSRQNTSKRPNETFAKGQSNMGQAPIKCPKCKQTFTQRCRLLFHYGRVHQEWKPYYCRWPKCNFTSAIDHIVITHADSVHFKFQNRQKAKKYVGKREEDPPKDPVLEQIKAFKFDHGKSGFGQTRSICPRCGRNLYAENIKQHIRTHEKPGYSCAWSKCGFFYSRRTEANKHLYSDHLRVEKANSQQTKRYLVKVNPKTGKTSKVIIRQTKKENNHDNSEDEENSDSDDDDDENSEI